MNSRNPQIRTTNSRIIGILFVVAFILLIPLIAMQFSSEVNWGAFDFLVAAILLSGVGITIEFLLRKVGAKGSRIVIIAVILIGLFLVWAELAVGVFGSPFAGS